MKTITSQNTKFAGLKPALLIAAALMLSLATPAWADKEKQGNKAEVVRPDECYRGQSYAEWSADWWQWFMQHPIAGHPSVDDPDFNVRSGQHGNVWFLAAPFGSVERTVTIPKNKALFIGLLNAEGSDLEGLGSTEAEQRDSAKFFADHIVNLACTIDGKPVAHLDRFRVSSPQFDFTAPTPWIFGATGGEGTAVGDGYYLLIEPLSKGQHTIQYSGAFHFTLAEDGFDLDLPLDMTYRLNVK